MDPWDMGCGAVNYESGTSARSAPKLTGLIADDMVPAMVASKGRTREHTPSDGTLRKGSRARAPPTGYLSRISLTGQETMLGRCGAPAQLSAITPLNKMTVMPRC